MSEPSTQNATLELQAQQKWLLLVKAEDNFFLQRSRVQWLANRDCNTAYFHQMMNMRRATYHIHYLIAPSGERFDTQSGVMNHYIEYFSTLLGDIEEPRMFIQEDMDLLLPNKCSDDQKCALTKPFTRAEIRDVFFALPHNKTCGPDGYSAEFFCGCWDIVGSEVCEAIEEFFASSSMLRQWNATTLILVPKIPNTSTTSDFRPISCLNTIYKVVSKLLESRLLPVLMEIIPPHQSAFMPERLLGENVLLATDLV